MEEKRWKISENNWKIDENCWKNNEKARNPTPNQKINTKCPKKKCQLNSRPYTTNQWPFQEVPWSKVSLFSHKTWMVMHAKIDHTLSTMTVRSSQC